MVNSSDSLHNISIHDKHQERIMPIDKFKCLIKRVRWKVYFATCANNKESVVRKYGFKINEPHSEIVSDFEREMVEIINKLKSKNFITITKTAKVDHKKTASSLISNYFLFFTFYSKFHHA